MRPNSGLDTGHDMTRVAESHILLVEDNEDDAFLLSRALRAAEIENPVHVVADGEEAVNYLKGKGRFGDRTQYPIPGLILLDLKLPRISGLEVLQWIQNETSLPQLVVVVLSSSGETRDINMAYRFGARSYLVKPPTAASFVEMAKGLKTYWLHLNKAPSGN
jgi:CheY-like chemotaxis protein